MKKLISCFALASLLALGGSAIAEIGTIDDVPAATLLLPYFEVDLDNPAGVTTLFSINNASAAPALVHVVVWTDLSIHILDFNVYLTGYDVFTQNLRDLFINGTSPRTEDTNDSDAISPVGEYSWETNPVTGVGPGLPNCALPYDEPLLSETYIEHVQNALTGQASDVLLFGGCSGIDHGDHIARGYITMDSVNDCSLKFPEDSGYFDEGATPGLANESNQIWGDYFYVYDAENFAQGETLVHIEADPALGIDNYTFYYRYSEGDDHREGLGSTFAVRYLEGGAFSGGTSLLVWRDAKVEVDFWADGEEDNGFDCDDEYPDPFPLGNNQTVIFDEDENPEVPETCQISPCPPGQFLTPFPWEAQRTVVGSSLLPVAENFGWFYLNLNNEVEGSPVDLVFGDAMQNWVTAVMDANGRFSVGFDAIQLDNVTYGGTDVELPVPEPQPAN